MADSVVLYQKDGAIATLTLNRPEARNALNEQVRTELYEALEKANVDEEVRGIIITGGKEVFSGGADIQAMSQASAVEIFYRQGLQKVVNRIETMPKPVIASIAGYALGGGCELALACDVRIAADNAVLGQPEIRLGIIPGGGGTQRLARQVGAGHAKDIIFSGRMVNADEAQQIGLVEYTVPADNLEEETVNRMNKYIRHGGVAVGASKIAINTGSNVDLQSGDTLENLCFSLLFATEDQKEGMKAFLEKRKPEFKNK